MSTPDTQTEAVFKVSRLTLEPSRADGAAALETCGQRLPLEAQVRKTLEDASGEVSAIHVRDRAVVHTVSKACIAVMGQQDRPADGSPQRLAYPLRL